MRLVNGCPFCGNDDETRFSYRFKRDKRKVNGIYYQICTMTCEKCGASVSQAGPTKYEAEENMWRLWNRRVSKEI